MNFEKKKDCSKEANLLFELLKHRVNVLSDSFDYNDSFTPTSKAALKED